MTLKNEVVSNLEALGIQLNEEDEEIYAPLMLIALEAQYGEEYEYSGYLTCYISETCIDIYSLDDTKMIEFKGRNASLIVVDIVMALEEIYRDTFES